MGRIALVTGGTRGFGAAIANRMKASGLRVVSVFQGNFAAAEAFHRETGIPICQWDVADYGACVN